MLGVALAGDVPVFGVNALRFSGRLIVICIDQST
jgi:hypothetical protein